MVSAASSHRRTRRQRGRMAGLARNDPDTPFGQLYGAHRHELLGPIAQRCRVRCSRRRAQGGQAAGVAVQQNVILAFPDVRAAVANGANSQSISPEQPERPINAAFLLAIEAALAFLVSV